MPCGFNSIAARSASSICSPGMKRATERRTNAVLVARSRSHGLVDPASSTFRINDIKDCGLPTADCGFGFPIGDRGLPIFDWSLAIADCHCRLPIVIADCRLPIVIADCRLVIGDFRLVIDDCDLPYST